ncbi:ATP-binding protein [Acaryochloris thomasi]|nr:ATP-binding protein [Acaryochloris thomasi]
MARFDPQKKQWKNIDIAQSLSHSWISDNPVQIFQDNLRVICRVLAESGCCLGDSIADEANVVGRYPKGESPWQKAYQWLWAQRFPQWSVAREEHMAQRSGISPLSVKATIADLPFGDRGRITDENRFFDRVDLFGQLFVELAKGCNVSLVGMSEIGKSSILSMICQKGPRVPSLSSYGFVLINMEWVHGENDLFESLCYSLGIKTCRGFALKRALQQRRYILCIDEIEKMTRSDLFSGDERSELRGLADGFDAPLSLVIASRTNLDLLFPDSPVMTSPLAGLFGRPYMVGNFTPEIASQFLRKRLSETEVEFTEAEIQRLISETDGHPARLQQAAAQLYRSYTN